MTLKEALHLIRSQYTQKLHKHELGFIYKIKSLSDHQKFISPKEEKFVFWIAKRLGLSFETKVFDPPREKPSLPAIIYDCPVEPDPSFKEPALRPAYTSYFIQTGLGMEFDAVATIEQLAHYKPKPPYDQKFMNRSLITIYGIDNHLKLPIGQLFLEMISYASKDPEERAKVSTFLIAMNQIESLTEPEPKKIKKPRKPSRKLHLVCYK